MDNLLTSHIRELTLRYRVTALAQQRNMETLQEVSVAGENESFGFYEGECQACDCYGSLDDMGLCESCAGKLERDFIRQRDWDYSALAFGVPVERREELRKKIIAEYGKKLELIAPEK